MKKSRGSAVIIYKNIPPQRQNTVKSPPTIPRVWIQIGSFIERGNVIAIKNAMAQINVAAGNNVLPKIRSGND